MFFRYCFFLRIVPYAQSPPGPGGSRKPDQSESQCTCKALSHFLFRIGLGCNEAERVGHSGKPPPPDKLQVVAAPSCSRVLPSDQDMDVRIALITHVVHKLDLASEMVGVAAGLAIGKHPNRLGRLGVCRHILGKKHRPLGERKDGKQDRVAGTMAPSRRSNGRTLNLLRRTVATIS